MITYTKRNVNLLTLIITLLIFILFQFFCSMPNLESSKKQYFPKQVYSKSFPIDSKIASTQLEDSNPILFQTNLKQNTNLEETPINSIQTAYTILKNQEKVEEKQTILER